MSTKAELDLMESVIDTDYSLFLRRQQIKEQKEQERHNMVKDIQKCNNPFRALVKLIFGKEGRVLATDKSITPRINRDNILVDVNNPTHKSGGLVKAFVD